MKLVMNLYPVLIPVTVMFFVQFTKIIIDFLKTKKFKFNAQWLFSAGWFPSVHSAISTSISTLVALEYWIWSMLFAVTSMFTLLFIYDAMNVRYEAGKHAHYINNLKLELEETLQREPISPHLKERLWHTPVEVVGWIIFGCLLTILLSKAVWIW